MQTKNGLKRLALKNGNGNYAKREENQYGQRELKRPKPTQSSLNATAELIA